MRSNPCGVYGGEAMAFKFSGKEILADIERKNEAENMGNFTVSGTKIKLLNFSVRPKCAKIFSFKDMSDYYAKPKSNPRHSRL